MKMENAKNDEYTICFRYIILIMKIFGIFPFFPIHEVINVSQLSSTLLTILPVSLTVATNAIVVPIVFIYFINLLPDFGFTQFIGFGPSGLLTVFVSTTPFLTWNKTKQLQNYRKNWIRFQIKMEELTRTPFECQVKNKIRRIFPIGMVCTSMDIIMTGINDRKETIRMSLKVSTTLYLLNGTANVMMYWVVNNMYAKSCAKKITDLVRETMNKNKDVDLRRLIVLWTMLCDLNEDFDNSHSILFLSFFALIATFGIIHVFNAVILFLYFPDRNLQSIVYLIGTAICAMCLMTFCESADAVTKNMVYELKKALLSENVITKNEKFLQAMLSFLQTIENKNAQITFSGYMPVDRSLAVPILGTAINFLVVLRQSSPV